MVDSPRRRIGILILALALTATVVGSVAVPSAAKVVKPARLAAPGAGDTTAPPIMTEAARLSEMPAAQAQSASQPLAPRSSYSAGAISPKTPQLQREVFGFVNAYNLGDPNVGYTTWNYNLLSTIAYFGLHVNSGDGNLVTNDTGWAVFNSPTMTSFINLAHANGVRVIVSINLHDFSISVTNQVCEGLIAAHTVNTINQTVALMKSKGIDGINVNYEGTLAVCADNLTNRQELVSFMQNLRAAMPVGSYLAIDTFSGSAEDNLEFFDITGLAPYVDSFFVMAYDMDYANYSEVPLSCSSYCFNPVSPLNTYRFNATKSVAQYTALVPPSKVILGQPYYGRRGCVGRGDIAHSYLTRDLVGTTYLFASTIPSQHGVFSFHAYRDPLDGVSEWDTWWDTDWNCIREQYFDDQESLSAKYNLVNQANLRGVGFFTLDYGGGAAELWARLAAYFSCPVAVNVLVTQTTTEFRVGLNAGGCSVVSYTVQQFDTTLNQGWYGVKAVVTGNGTGQALAEGYPGHSYLFRARAQNTVGVVSAWAEGTTSIAANATASHPFAGMYTLDAYGGINSVDSPPLAGSAYWSGWAIARTARAMPGSTSPQSGAVLDGWGGLHPYGAPITIAPSAYWSGWDIARDFAFLPDGTGGLVLDGYGGLHPFHVNGNTGAINVQGSAYWAGWDIARKVVIFADGSGGYVMDAWGGLHPFGINGPSPVSPAKIAATGYWSGWDIARDIVMAPGNGNHSGYVLDGWGGLHPFHPTTDGSAMPAAISSAYWSGWDIARGVWLLPGSATAGYTMDGWGGLHAFGGAPAVVTQSYWSGRDIARSVWGG